MNPPYTNIQQYASNRLKSLGLEDTPEMKRAFLFGFITDPKEIVRFSDPNPNCLHDNRDIIDNFLTKIEVCMDCGSVIDQPFDP